MISRRGVVALAGGGVAAAGLWRAADQGLILAGDRPGLAAWDDWARRRHAAQLSLVSAGVLAASPHNTQPWRFAVGRLGVDIFEVPERDLGARDPFGRERLAGLGAAIHNMALASTGIARSGVVRLLPDPGNPRHVARILLGPEGQGPAPHPLLAAIGRRHTHRGAWRGGGLGAVQLAGIRSFPRPPAIGLTLFGADSARGRRFAALTDDATVAITQDAAMMAASHRWFRHERRDQDRLKDGLTIRTSRVAPLLAFAGAMLPEGSADDEGRYWLQATRDTALPSASMFGLITTPDPWDRRNALLAGAAWQRLHLEATQAGLVAQPLNQLPEMVDRERQLGRSARFAAALDPLLDDRAMRPTFAFRLGTADALAPAALRRPVSEVLGPPARLAWEVDQWRREGGGF